MRRHVPSTIEKLDPKVRETINNLRIDHGYTLDQILDHLKQMDVVVKRSSLGRHVKKLEDKVGAKIRELRVAAEAVSRKIDDAADNKVAALNRELAHSIVMRTATSQDQEGEDVVFTPQETMYIAKALDHLASAEKKDAERFFMVRKEQTDKTLKAVDEKLRANKQPGLSKETIADLKRELLGIPE